jgi:hypothetical protein
MNLTTANAAVTTWKRVKMHYLVAFGGIALALVAAIGFAGSKSGERAVPARLTGLRSAISIPAPAQSAWVAYYLVSSQEQADVVLRGEQEAARERLSTGMPETAYTGVVVVAGPAEAALALKTAVAMASSEDESATTREVIDLRRP